jgi:UDP-N-acetylglucosamine transferase subunit ALG13
VIFVTVGTDGPFDRLVDTVDRWAARTGYADVFAQIGRSTMRPGFIRFTNFLEPPEFTRYFASASLIVSHAGMGTILTALRHQKPLLVMPRRAALGEQRNDHQLATARRLQALGKVTVAFDENELVTRLGTGTELVSREPLGPFAQPELIAALRGFIERPAPNGARPPKG